MARRFSIETRSEPIAIASARYGGAERVEQSQILDEFVEISRYHRKRAIRLQSSADVARSPHELSWRQAFLVRPNPGKPASKLKRARAAVP